MIHQFARGLLQSIFSVRTLCGVLIIVGYELVHVAGESQQKDVNGWDALFPSLTDSLTVVVVGLSWWLLWVIPVAGSLARDDQLIRHGSIPRATFSGLAFLGGVLSGFGVLLAGASIGVGASLGLPATWSASASGFADGTPSAYASAAFAQHFADPVSAIVSVAAFSALGFLVIAAVAVSVSCRGQGRTASALTIGLALWTMICSFSPVPISMPADTSLTVSLGWALAAPGGLLIGVAWLIGGCVVAAAGMLVPLDLRVLLPAAAGRATSIVVLTAIAIIASINAGQRAREQGVPLVTAFFAGTHGDIVSYLLIGLIPAIFATSFLARNANIAEVGLLYGALRHGSYRRWLSAALVRELEWAVILTLIVTGIVTLATSSGLGHSGSSSEMVEAAASGAAGLLAATLLQVVIAAALTWAGAALSASWPISIGLMLALGYWFPSGMSFLNIFAPYSLAQDAFEPVTTITAASTAMLAAIALFVATLTRATPQNANFLAQST